VSTRGRKADIITIHGGLSGVPRMPKSIPPEMADEWLAVAAEMVERKILTTPGVGLLETYIVARWTVGKCQAAIAEHGILVVAGHGQLKTNPASTVLTKAMETVARLAAELGLTPAARSKQTFQTGKETNDQGAPPGLVV
jgi:P27 family predicted phage terminase small subunit